MKRNRMLILLTGFLIVTLACIQAVVGEVKTDHSTQPTTAPNFPMQLGEDFSEWKAPCKKFLPTVYPVSFPVHNNGFTVISSRNHTSLQEGKLVQNRNEHHWEADVFISGGDGYEGFQITLQDYTIGEMTVYVCDSNNSFMEFKESLMISLTGKGNVLITTILSNGSVSEEVIAK